MASRPTKGSTPEPSAADSLNPAEAAKAAAENSGADKAVDPREKIVEALFDLLYDRDWNDIGLCDIAERAGVSLAKLRELFPSKGAILAGFMRRIDLDVLGHDARDMADEPTRERLFDVLMRRFEALAPYRDGLRKVRDGLRTDPLGAAAMNQLAVSSMQWMLAAAGVRESGPLGAARAQGLALVVARVFDTFLNDPEEGLSRTMKKLDGELRRAERFARAAEDAERLTAPFRGVIDRLLGGGRRRGDDRDGHDDAAAA